jgi:serine/threonine-protein phosphatase 6 regulatory ankyrin repeat subunit B
LICTLLGCGKAGNIHDAAKEGKVSEVKGLLNRDASLVNAGDQNGCTPLHYGIFHGSIAEVLLAKGADINARDSEGKTPLMWTMQTAYKLKDTIVLIVDTANIRKGEEGKNPLRGTPFALLAPTGVVNFSGKETLEFLLNNGADPNIQANDSYTVLTLAIVNVRHDLVEFLLSKGAGIKGTDKSGINDALNVAVSRDDRKSIEMILAAGAEVNGTDKAGRTPLHFAAEYGRMWVLQLFLSKGADISKRDRDGRTPLHMAAKSRSMAADNVKLLLANGADPNAKDMSGKTPIELAAYPEVAEAFRQSAVR